MPPTSPAPRAIALLALLTLATASAAARADGDGAVVVTPADGSAEPIAASAYALRMDNYVDVVDSVLNARLRPRRVPVPSLRPNEGTSVTGPDGVREDTLHVRRAVRPPRLPAGPLTVRTTAAFVGAGAPAGAATWPPTAGRLSITAGDGSRIELDAGNGDIASVNVTVVSGTRLHVFREPWETWAPMAPNER